MSRSDSLLLIPLLLGTLLWAPPPSGAAGAQNSRLLGLGRPATVEQIRGWDIDVLPDGSGLPRGRGSVAAGQAPYEAKCASCHGVFGESTDWIPIAGGVRPQDLVTGRARTLAESEPIRTVGTKLNSAATLWDYIYRSQPLNAPKSLGVDETYSIVAYVLHLNEILPAEAEVTEATLAQVPMANRLGFTDRHGFMTRHGRPDVRNTACMRNCEAVITVTSEIPDHARGSHGNLREQMRPYGPVRGVDTTLPSGASAERHRSGAFAAVPADAPVASPIAALLRGAGCSACHGVDNRIIGPGFGEIAARYRGNSAAEEALTARIRTGGVGTWGPVPMPAQAQVTDIDLKSIVRWILAGARP